MQPFNFIKKLTNVYSNLRRSVLNKESTDSYLRYTETLAKIATLILSIIAILHYMTPARAEVKIKIIDVSDHELIIAAGNSGDLTASILSVSLLKKDSEQNIWINKLEHIKTGNDISPDNIDIIKFESETALPISTSFTRSPKFIGSDDCNLLVIYIDSKLVQYETEKKFGCHIRKKLRNQS